MAKKFCVMTMGRTGSTSLMYALRQFEDICLPSRLFTDCHDEELIHKKFVELRIEQFAHLRKIEINSPDELVSEYFEYYQDEPFVGFKSMLQYHDDYRQFVAQDDLFVITLIREDMASAIASFILAELRGTWRRFGKPITEKWTFTEQQHQSAKNKVRYLTRANIQLHDISDAVPLTYEQICTPGFASPELDQFFGRPVRMIDPRGATDASSYVENWEEFRQFIETEQEVIKTDQQFLASI